MLADTNFAYPDEGNSVEENEYLDVWSVLRFSDPGWTFDTHVNTMARQDKHGALFHTRIDRIWYRSNVLHPADVGIMGTSPVSECNGSIFPSDHFCLAAQFNLVQNNAH